MSSSHKRNLRAYYYGFDPTGDDKIDAILEAVARAGKAHHHTSEWYNASFDSTCSNDEGPTYIERIQEAAKAAAQGGAS